MARAEAFVVGRATPAAVKAAGTGEMVAHREDPAVSVDVDRAVLDQMARVQIILVAPVVLEAVRQPAIRYWLALVSEPIDVSWSGLCRHVARFQFAHELANVVIASK